MDKEMPEAKYWGGAGKDGPVRRPVQATGEKLLRMVGR
jgi:hypothetical protein